MQLQWKPEKRTPDLADVFTFHSHAFSAQSLFAEVLGSALLPMRFSFSPFQVRVLARFFFGPFLRAEIYTPRSTQCTPSHRFWNPNSKKRAKKNLAKTRP